VKMTGRQSLALPCGVLKPQHLWALVFMDESCCDVPMVTLGQMNAQCPNCGAAYWQAEHFAPPNQGELPYWCCGKSERQMLSERGFFKPIRDDFIHKLYHGNTSDAKHFKHHIRSYNAILSLAMPYVRYDKAGHYAKTVTVNGKITFNAPSCP